MRFLRLAHATLAPAVLAVLATALAPSSTSLAQQPPVNGMRPSEPARFALVGGRILVAPGRAIEKGNLLVADGLVVGAGESLAVPDGFRVIDCTGKTVLPAFIEPALVLDSAALASAAAGAPGAHWNQLVVPQVAASDLAVPDATVDLLRAQGFAVARVLPEDGIFRGTSDVRVLGRASERVIGRDLGGRHVQFVGPRSIDWSAAFAPAAPGAPATPGTPAPSMPRGGDRSSSYPTSLMGSYALLRQTFRDAAWRRTCLATPGGAPLEEMTALDALLPLAMPADDPHATHLLVEASDELELARLLRLAAAEAPGTPVSVLGSGLEFRAQDSLVALLRDANAPLLLPVDFPQPPDLVSPTAADSVSLRDLMTWRYAPTNPKRLVASGTRIALTTHRLQDKSAFRKRVADAIAHGLSKDEALAALTTSPAEILGLDGRVGTLDERRVANVLIASGDPFDPETKFEGVFITGVPIALPSDPPVLAAGTFDATPEGPTPKPVAADLRVVIDPKDGTLKVTWTKERDAKTDDAKDGGAKDVGAKDDGSSEDRSRQQAATASDAAAAPADPNPSAPAAEASSTATATARRASVGTDGRASGVLDGAPFGFEGDVRVAIAGTGDRATMIVETSTGARHAFALARRDASTKDATTATTAATDGTESRTDSTDDAANSVTPPSGEGKPDAKSDAKPDAKSNAKPDTKPDERLELWKDELPFPLGEFGLTRAQAAARPRGTIVVKDATIWTLGPLGTIKDGDMLVRDGRIELVAPEIAVPDGAHVVDGRGRHVTPGLVDCHSHTGISGGVNEGTQANTAEVTIGDVIDPTDVEWYRQLAGGLVAANQLHGSANPIGGRNSVVKIRWGSDADAFRFIEAPPGIKFALGENVVRSRGRYPNSRMGVAAYLEDSFLAAREYRAAQRRHAEAAGASRPPRPDLELETLAEILEGKRLVHCHSYRQDEILMLIRLADRLGFRVGTFQHVLEGYKVAPEIAAHGAGASSFSDWWAYKIEVMDAIPWNGAMLSRAGAVVSFNSDSDELARRMNMEAAKAVRYGGVAPEEALSFVSLNPARQLGVDRFTGSLEAGKHADFVVWNGPPLSAFTRCEETWVDGVRLYARDEERALHEEVVRRRGELLAKATSAGDAARGPAAGGDGPRGRRGRAPTLLERMLEDREETIWLRIARGLDPIPDGPGVCGCGDAPGSVPVERFAEILESSGLEDSSAADLRRDARN